jgi:hypothetical protein
LHEKNTKQRLYNEKKQLSNCISKASALTETLQQELDAKQNYILKALHRVKNKKHI